MRNDLLEWMAGATILLLIATTGYAQLAECAKVGGWQVWPRNTIEW